MLVFKIAIGLFLIFLGWGIYLIVKVGSMSDEDRESYGFGPKGQGRQP